MASNDYAETVAGALIAQLEQGTAPWQKPWKPGERFMPYNPTTGAEYKGMNAVWLLSISEAQGFGDARWMTYKQSAAEGGQVRKGEKGSLVQYWKFRDEKTLTDDNGRPLLDERGQPRKTVVELERPRVFSAVVFNAAQIDGLPPAAIRPALSEWERHERAEAILTNSQADIQHRPGDRAFYSPGLDGIVLPERGQFGTGDAYYATALHELGHWTGHKTRLDRDLSHPFGSEGYAKEELRAEIASLMLGEQLSIGHDPGQHAAYVKSWIKVLKDDPREVFRAASDAERITKFVKGFEQSQQIERQADDNTVQITVPNFTPPSEVAVKTSDERVYLAVPYGEKNEAKALGARWDKSFGDKGSWYAPAGTDLSALSRWMPGQGDSIVAIPEPDPKEEFATALREAGLQIGGEPIMDGQLRRVPVDGDKGNEKSGAYVGFNDGHPAGYINNYKSGIEQRWKSAQQSVAIGAQDRARQAAEAAERRQERAKERDAQFELVAAAVDAHLAAGTPASAEHPYLARKGVQPHGASIDTAGSIAMPPGDADPQQWSKAGNLLIPVRDMDGNLMGAQSIDPDGRKSFPRGGRVMGGSHLLGDLATPGPLLIAEGFATAATLHEATGLPVAVAFNGGNLEAVAKGYRERYPDRALLVAGDNDHRKELELGPDGQPKQNVGKVKAEAAAVAVGGATLLPPFKTEERGSDWNDFAASRDRETFVRELRSGFAIAQRQALTKEAKAERLAPQLAQDKARVQDRDPRRLPELEGVKQTHKRAHAR